jgi:hypothetical protein
MRPRRRVFLRHAADVAAGAEGSARASDHDHRDIRIFPQRASVSMDFVSSSGLSAFILSGRWKVSVATPPSSEVRITSSGMVIQDIAEEGWVWSAPKRKRPVCFNRAFSELRTSCLMGAGSWQTWATARLDLLWRSGRDP